VLTAVRLPLRFDPAPLQADVAGLDPDDWIPHYNTQLYSGDWSGVPLRSVGGAARQIYPDPASTQPFMDTPVLERCPNLGAVVASFECPLQAVRLLRLGPGAAVGEHRDYRLGYDDGEVRVHVPVHTNPGAEMVLEGRQIDMAEGEAWYLDVNCKHSVANRGEVDRIHLVIDCDLNPWLDARLHEGAAATPGAPG
jgi:hypothetical protein